VERAFFFLLFHGTKLKKEKLTLRIATFKTAGGVESCGIVKEHKIYELKEKNLLDIVIRSEGKFEVLKSLADKALQNGAPFDLSQVEILSPIPRPPSMRDGYAFRQHVLTARKNRGLEMIPEFDLFPVFYFTNHQGVTGPGDVHVQSLHTDKLDYELEVAIVIGKKGRNISVSDADNYIFGYTIMNDWSARTLQMEEMKLNLGPAKGKDFATSLGPYLITRDELLNDGHLKPSSKGEVYHGAMKAFVNGKELSSGNMNQMNWTFAQIIERASYGVTLYPGDIIGSGTVGTGCLLELNGSKITDNLWLKPGDIVKLEVDGLGVLENKIILDGDT
jgi:fumarylacetoacetate (FAA) hydrolase